MQKNNLNPNSISQFNLQFPCQLHLIAAVLLLSLAFSGCSKRYDDLPTFSAVSFGDYENESVGRFKTSYLVEQFDNYYRGTSPGPIGVTTFVNLDDLYTTSSFGRMLSEQVMSELAMRGFDIVELRHSDALQFLSASGEFGLSRDAGFVRRERELGGVVVGTYVASPVRVYVNARLLDPTSSKVLTVGSVEMDKTKEITRLLRGGSLMATLERIPVKHIGFSSYPMNVFSGGSSRVSEIDEQEPTRPRDWHAPVLPPLESPSIKPDKSLKTPH